MEEYLAASDIVDWKDEHVRALAEKLAGQADGEESLARATFEWVRDNVEHSVDFNRSEITCRASEVLAVRTGFCYAKSHLAAALLRANGIPTGFCYQRLSVSGEGPPYCLHGLNAAYLKKYGWYRFDVRGDKASVSTAFTPPDEQLAFSTSAPEEADLPEIWPAPLPVVVTALQAAHSVEELWKTLPDIQLISRRPTGKEC